MTQRFSQNRQAKAILNGSVSGNYPFDNYQAKDGVATIDVKLPNGRVLTLDASGIRANISKGTANIQSTGGDASSFEVIGLSGEVKNHYTASQEEEYLQNPSNKEQRIGVNADGAYIRTNGKSLKIGDDYEFHENSGILKGKDGLEVNLKTGEVKGKLVSINLNTGEISGNLTSNGTIRALNIP